MRIRRSEWSCRFTNLCHGCVMLLKLLPNFIRGVAVIGLSVLHRAIHLPRDCPR